MEYHCDCCMYGPPGIVTTWGESSGSQTF